MKLETSNYRCLSEKDKKDLKAWEDRVKKRKNRVKKKDFKKNLTLTELVKQVKGKSYREFLNSEYWKRVRAKVLKRDNYKCVICGSKFELQVHHDSYKNHFREHLHLGDLMTLCKCCHKEHHFCS